MSPSRRDQASVAALEQALAEAVDDIAILEEQRSRLAAALGEIVDGVIVVDADGDEVFRNTAAERYRDARHSDAVAASEIETMLADAAAGEAVKRELQLFGPPRVVLQLRGFPLFDGESLLGAAVFVQDISELHRVESVRRDFVANVSHELKTPIGALELLAETLAEESDPAITRPLAERLVKEAERLGRIVDDLLDLSLIEIQESPSRDPVPVSLLLDEAVDRMEPAAAASGIGLRVDNAAGDATLYCDRRQIVSALTNLLDNAVKYSERGSTIDVRACLEGDRTVFEVHDHGIGIPRGDLERIFERFYRVDQARSRDTGGTGLGLAIVRHVAHAHGGEVTVTSVEGQGSTFQLGFPLGLRGAPTDEQKREFA
jgi:two-component system, OmpR family, sensor histidine kinase SenX3